MRFSSLMKTARFWALSSALSFSFAAPCFAQDITSNLVGYWTLDETSGTTVIDRSGNGYTGTISGSDAAAMTSNGQVDTALTFDGSNDAISILSDPTDLRMDQDKSMTFAAWVMHTNAGGFQTIIRYDDNDTRDGDGPTNRNLYALRLTNTQKIEALFGYRATLSSVVSTATLSPNTWYHVVFVRDVNADTETIYINGTLDNSETDETTGTWETTGQYPVLGSFVAGGSERLNGSIDEMRIYDRALSADDVAALYAYRGVEYDCATPDGYEGEMRYNATKKVVQFCNGSTWKAIGAPYNSAFADAADVTSGLVGHWKLNETSGTTAADSSGNGYDGTINGSDAATMSTTGHDEYTAFEFDGEDNYIEVPYNAALDIALPLTISAWVKPTSTPYEGPVFQLNHRANGYEGAWLNLTTDELAINFGDGGSPAAANRRTKYADSLSLSSNQWYHIAGVIRDATDMDLYLDGVDIGGSYSGGGGSIAYQAGLPSTIGLTRTRYTDNVIDDVSVYDRALSAEEISTLATGRLVAHWTLDDTSGTTITEARGVYHGTLSGTTADAATTNGVIGTALNFDGINDRITIPSSTDFDGNTGTWSLWFRTDGNWGVDGGSNGTSVKGVTSLISRVSSSNSQSGTNVMIMSDGNLLLQSKDSTNTVVLNPSTSGINTVDNKWHHIAYIYSKASGANNYLYLDGNLVLTDTNSGAWDFDSQDINIGDSASPWWEEFYGSIDDIRIYKYALSAEQIQELYEDAPNCSATSAGLLAHWTFDDTSGTTAADSSTNSYDGTINGSDAATMTTTGQNSTALNFDGSDDYIDAGVSVINTLPVTISGWVYFDSFPASQTQTLFQSNNHSSEQCGIRISSAGNATGTSGSISINSGGQCNGGDGGQRVHQTPSDTVLTAGQWYHLSIVYREFDDITLYLNGSEYPTTSVYGAATDVQFDSTAYTTLGNPIYSATQYFDGSLDDWRVYNFAMSSNEVEQLYGATGGECLSSLSACSDPFGYEGTLFFNTDYNVMQFCNGDEWMAMGPPSDGGTMCSSPTGYPGEMRYHAVLKTPIYCEGNEWMAMGPPSDVHIPTDGLLYYWPMEDTSGTTVTETISSAHGTISGSSASNMTVTGIDNNALSFDGSDDIINATSATGGNSDEGSISLWFKGSVSGDAIAMLWMGCGTCGDGFGDENEMHLYTLDNGDSLGFFIRGNSGNLSIGERYIGISDNQWHHAVATWDNTGNAYIYLDGEELDSAPYAGNSFTFTNGQVLGRQSSTSNSSRRFQGSIDDVRYYNRALTADEVGLLHVATAYNDIDDANLFLHYTMDETTGTSIYDSSSNGNDATINASDATSMTSTGRIGKALTFDGSTTYLTVPYENHDRIIYHTTSFWIKTTATTAHNVFFRGNSGNCFYNPSISINASGQIQHLEPGCGAANQRTSTGSINDGQWHHVVVKRDGTNEYIYIDGELNVSNTITNTGTGSVRTYIGAGYHHTNGTTVNPIDGELDDFRFYKRALTEKEIVKLYELGN